MGNKIDNPEELGTYGTHDGEKQSKTQHSVVWAELYANKHK
jgi:hypothetical protein